MRAKTSINRSFNGHRSMNGKIAKNWGHALDEPSAKQISLTEASYYQTLSLYQLRFHLSLSTLAYLANRSHVPFSYTTSSPSKPVF